MLLDDVRETIEATLDTLTPANAQKLRSLLDPACEGAGGEERCRSAGVVQAQPATGYARDRGSREIQATSRTWFFGAAPRRKSTRPRKKRVRSSSERPRTAYAVEGDRAKKATAKPASAKAVAREGFIPARRRPPQALGPVGSRRRLRLRGPSRLGRLRSTIGDPSPPRRSSGEAGPGRQPAPRPRRPCARDLS